MIYFGQHWEAFNLKDGFWLDILCWFIVFISNFNIQFIIIKSRILVALYKKGQLTLATAVISIY